MSIWLFYNVLLYGCRNRCECRLIRLGVSVVLGRVMCCVLVGVLIVVVGLIVVILFLCISMV